MIELQQLQAQRTEPFGAASPRLGEALPPDDDRPLPPHLLQLLLPCGTQQAASQKQH